MNAIRAWVASHKKFTATLLGALAALIPDRYLDEQTKQQLIGLVIAFVVGQGIADANKEAAKIHAISGTGVPTVVTRETSGPAPKAPLVGP